MHPTDSPPPPAPTKKVTGRRAYARALAERATVRVPTAKLVKDEKGEVTGVSPNRHERRKEAAAKRRGMR